MFTVPYYIVQYHADHVWIYMTVVINVKISAECTEGLLEELAAPVLYLPIATSVHTQ